MSAQAISREEDLYTKLLAIVCPPYDGLGKPPPIGDYPKVMWEPMQQYVKAYERNQDARAGLKSALEQLDSMETDVQQGLEKLGIKKQVTEAEQKAKE
jgi:hypothetical protein